MESTNDPSGYGLLAENVPEGFIAVGVDGETWISKMRNKKLEWKRASAESSLFIKDDGTPANSPNNTPIKENNISDSIHQSVKHIKTSSKRKRSASPTPIRRSLQRSNSERIKDIFEDSPLQKVADSQVSKSGRVKSKSGLLWLGDPIELLLYGQTHSLEQFIKEIGKKESCQKKIFQAAKGIAWTEIDTQKPSIVYSTSKHGERNADGICVLLNDNKE